MTRPEGQLDGEVGPLEDAAVLRQQAVDQTMEEGRGHREGSPQEVLDAPLELLGKDGGDHLQFPCWRKNN